MEKILYIYIFDRRKKLTLKIHFRHETLKKIEQRKQGLPQKMKYKLYFLSIYTLFLYGLIKVHLYTENTVNRENRFLMKQER